MSASLPLARAKEFALASLIASYPDDDLAELVRMLPLAEHPGAGQLQSYLARPGALDDLRSAYVELFERGGDRASLNETEYGRMAGMSKGSDLADIAGFYRAFGVELDRSHGHETSDHLAVELEFYALLLTKQAHLVEDAEGTAVVLDARRKFLADHLGRFPAVVAARVAAKNELYGVVFGWVRDLVAAECAALGVRPPPLDFFADPEVREEMQCGAVHLPVVS